MNRKLLFSTTFVAIFLIACQSETAELPANTVSLIADRSIVSKNDTLRLNIHYLPSGNNFAKWIVTPAAGAAVSRLFSNDGKGKIIFNQAGTYRIAADLRTVHPDCIPTPVWDTCYASRPSFARPEITITVRE